MDTRPGRHLLYILLGVLACRGAETAQGRETRLFVAGVHIGMLVSWRVAMSRVGMLMCVLLVPVLWDAGRDWEGFGSNYMLHVCLNRTKLTLVSLMVFHDHP